MIRNQSFGWLIISMIVISFIGTLIGIFISTATAITVAAISLLLTIMTFLFTKWRYEELKDLSSYLRKISSGNYTLDVRDNYEGELSILKNDIFKVTSMLAEQSELLQADKLH